MLDPNYHPTGRSTQFEVEVRGTFRSFCHQHTPRRGTVLEQEVERHFPGHHAVKCAIDRTYCMEDSSHIAVGGENQVSCSFHFTKVVNSGSTCPGPPIILHHRPVQLARCSMG